MKQFMNGDFEGDTSVLFEANFMPTSTRSVRDDCVTSAITRDDVQVVCFSIAFDKSFTKIKFHSVWSFNYQTRPFLKKASQSNRPLAAIVYISIDPPDAAVLVDVLNPTSNRCPLRGGEGRVDSVGDNPIGPVVSFGQYLKCNDK